MSHTIARVPPLMGYRLMGRLDRKRLLQLFTLVSSIYSFWLIFEMDPYLPWKVRFIRAAQLTLIGHFGLWLGAIEWRGWFRFAAAVIFLPTMFGVSVLWGHFHTVAALSVFGWLGWHFIMLLKGGSSGT